MSVLAVVILSMSVFASLLPYSLAAVLQLARYINNWNMVTWFYLKVIRILALSFAVHFTMTICSVAVYEQSTTCRSDRTALTRSICRDMGRQMGATFLDTKTNNRKQDAVTHLHVYIYIYIYVYAYIASVNLAVSTIDNSISRIRPSSWSLSLNHFGLTTRIK